MAGWYSSVSVEEPPVVEEIEAEAVGAAATLVGRDGAIDTGGGGAGYDGGGAALDHRDKSSTSSYSCRKAVRGSDDGSSTVERAVKALDVGTINASNGDEVGLSRAIGAGGVASMVATITAAS